MTLAEHVRGLFDEWTQRFTHTGAVPLLVVGLCEDGSYMFCSPPLELTPLEGLADALSSTLQQVRQLITTPAVMTVRPTTPGVPGA